MIDNKAVMQTLDTEQMAFDTWRNGFVIMRGHMPTEADAWKARAAIARPHQHTKRLIEECRAALAEELAGFDIDPPLHHVSQAHDKCVAWLHASTGTIYCEACEQSVSTPCDSWACSTPEAIAQPAHVPETDCGNIAQPVEPTIKESLKVHASAEDYLRNKYSAYRWQFAQQDLEEAYSQGRYDEKMAQGPSPWPDDKSVNIAQPVESDDLTIAYLSGLADGKKAAQTAHVPETDCGNIAQPVEPATCEDCGGDGIVLASQNQWACQTCSESPITQPVTQADLEHVFETLYDHGNGKYRGAVSKAQRDKAIAICEALERCLAQPAQGKLLQIIAATYQIAGACDFPVHILDVLANPEKATQEQIEAMLPFVPPADERNFCRRCGKRLGGIDDVHTCTPAQQKETK